MSTKVVGPLMSDNLLETGVCYSRGGASVEHYLLEELDVLDGVS